VSDIDISVWGMVWCYLLFLPGLAILAVYRLGLIRRSLYSLARMSIQLALVGLYLKYIFAYNSFVVNLLWVAMMMVAANLTTFRQTGLDWKRFLLPATGALALTFGPVLAYFVLLITGKTLQDAALTIPIAGMLLGNSLRSNVTVLERFYRDWHAGEDDYLCRLMLGASVNEATLPFLRTALHAAVMPYMASFATIGLVSLPGMMTGQMLGGSTPMVAIKYQIAIMIAIFSATVLSAWLLIVFTRRRAWLSNGPLRPDLFTAGREPAR